jgi:hypothetical protein
MSTELNGSDKESLYEHWMKIWDIIPEEVRARFRHEHGCVLCENHRAYLADVQRQVRHDKMVKAAEMAKREAEGNGGPKEDVII